MPAVTRSFLFAGAACALAAVLPAPRAHADTLSWGTSGYTYSASQAGASATPGTVGTVNGNTVSISYGNSSFFATNAPSPAVGTYNATAGTGTSPIYTNGGATGTQALQILADFDNSAGNIIANSSIPVTIFFSKPVSNLMFSFYDVDNGTVNNGAFNDSVNNIFGLSTGSAAVRPMSLTPGADNTSANGVSSGSFTASGNNPQNAAGGNAAVTFGSTPITQFTFTYTDTDATATNPPAHSAIQIIALSDLTFNTVPEPSAWAFFAVAGGLGIWTLRRRARRQT